MNLVIVSNVSQSTFDNAKNMIEWMSDRVIQKFTQKREQPYDFKETISLNWYRYCICMTYWKSI